MNYRKAFLCIALAGTLSLSGCGSQESTNENTASSTEISVESSVEVSTEVSAEVGDENTVTGMVSSVTDTELIITTMPGGAQGPRGDNPPEGDTPADMEDSTEMPDSPPEGDTPADMEDSTEMPDSPPEGDAPTDMEGSTEIPDSPPEDGSGSPGSAHMTTQTIPLTDSTLFLDADGNETALSALSEGTMVTVTLDDDGNAVTVAVSVQMDGEARTEAVLPHSRKATMRLPNIPRTPKFPTPPTHPSAQTKMRFLSRKVQMSS